MRLLPPDERYPLTLPGFTRLAWVSESARALWTPRLARISRAWRTIEWLSVVEDLRPCHHNRYSNEQLAELAGEWARHGLISLPLAVEPAPNQTYADTVPSARPDGKVVIVNVVAKTLDTLLQFKSAWDARDHASMGRLLGFPRCCTSFFRAVWTDAECVDTTWPMASGTANARPGDDERSVDVQINQWATNILFRWLGVRAVPHLPCRFDCEESQILGQRFLSLGRGHGFEQEVDWLEELLSGPVEWSALHGIAEIRTLIAKVVTRTDATKHEFKVRVHGSGHATSTVHGLRFPYNMRAKPPKAPRLRVRDPSVGTGRGGDWLFRDNGFTTMEAMEQNHRPIVGLARRELEGTSGNVIDLGCGNGMLLKRICAGRSGLIPYGVEIELSAFRHIENVLPGFAGNFRHGDMFSPDTLFWDTTFAFAVLMIGRLLEVSPDRAWVLKEWLAANASRLLIYVYPDWSDRGLPQLAKKAGLTLLNGHDGSRQATAVWHP